MEISLGFYTYTVNFIFQRFIYFLFKYTNIYIFCQIIAKLKIKF